MRRELLREKTAQAIRFTTKDNKLYAFVLASPTDDIVIKTLGTGGLYQSEISNITMLGSSEIRRWDRSSSGLTITLPGTLPDQPLIGFMISKGSKRETEGD